MCDHTGAFCTLHRDQRLSRASGGLDADQGMFPEPSPLPFPPDSLSLFSIPLYSLLLASAFCMSFSICHFLHRCTPSPPITGRIHKSGDHKNTFISLTGTFQYRRKSNGSACSTAKVHHCMQQLGHSVSSERSADMVSPAGQHRQRLTHGTAENTHPDSPSRCECLHVTIFNTTDHPNANSDKA